MTARASAGTLLVCGLAVGAIVGLGLSHLPVPTPAPTPTSGPVSVNEDAPVVPDSPSESPLPPCPTEDSEGCYWDASEHGNGEGVDVVAPPAAEPDTTEPEVVTPAPEPVTEQPEPVTPWAQPTPPADWPFTTGETLVCGHDAKPALDYREDVGWWAYCEPALVQP